MATFTVDGVESRGNMKHVHGTFTTSDGDTTVSLAADTHGLNYIVEAMVTLDAGGLEVPQPKIAISSGTITATFSNTQGYSGRFSVTGR